MEFRTDIWTGQVLAPTEETCPDVDIDHVNRDREILLLYGYRENSEEHL